MAMLPAMLEGGPEAGCLDSRLQARGQGFPNPFASTTDGGGTVVEPLVLVDSSEIREGKLDELKNAMTDLAGFVESNEPRPIAYQMFLDDAGSLMTVVQVHPDSASAETHMKVATPLFARFTDLVQLRTIDIYGTPSDRLLAQMRQKADVLGAATLVVHDVQAGFTRFEPRLPEARMKRMEPPSSESYARAFGEWKIWFEWGSARFDAPGEGIPPAWFARRGTDPTESVPATDLTEEEFRRRLGELFDESTVEAVERHFEPRIANTTLGSVLAPRPSR